MQDIEYRIAAARRNTGLHSQRTGVILCVLIDLIDPLIDPRRSVLIDLLINPNLCAVIAPTKFVIGKAHWLPNTTYFINSR